jgi:hypothetical protein
VNVFLGLGLPWVYATLMESGKYSGPNGVNAGNMIADNDGKMIPFVYEGYFVPAASLGFSVVVFCCLAGLCILFLLVRRIKIGGELGGSYNTRVASAVLLISFWVIYIVLSIV